MGIKADNPGNGYPGTHLSKSSLNLEQTCNKLIEHVLFSSYAQMKAPIISCSKTANFFKLMLIFVVELLRAKLIYELPHSVGNAVEDNSFFLSNGNFLITRNELEKWPKALKNYHT